MVHSDDQGGMLEHDQVIGEQRDAGIQVEEVNPEDNIVKTARESQQERLISLTMMPEPRGSLEQSDVCTLS